MYSCKFQKRENCHEVMKSLTSSKAYSLRTCKDLRRELFTQEKKLEQEQIMNQRIQKQLRKDIDKLGEQKYHLNEDIDRLK
jgi:hypothetical protein